MEANERSIMGRRLPCERKSVHSRPGRSRKSNRRAAGPVSLTGESDPVQIDFPRRAGTKPLVASARAGHVGGPAGREPVTLGGRVNAQFRGT